MSAPVALVTGGASGIGFAIVRALVDDGYRVVVCGRSDDRLRHARALVPSLDTVRCDVTDELEVGALMDHVAARYGRLDLLVNNAELQDNYRFAQVAAIADRARREIELDLVAPVVVTHAALPLLRRSTNARVVMVGSGTAWAPKPDALVYSASKAALRSVTTGLRWELAPEGIGVVELVPPVVDTAMTAGRDDDKVAPELVADALVSGLRRDRERIAVGTMRLVPILGRLAPGVLERTLRAGVDAGRDVR